MKKVNRQSAALSALLSCALFCSAAYAEDVITIGTVSALSGPAAAWGQGQRNAVTLAAEQVNEEGGLIVAGKTYKVKVISYDGAGQADKAITATQRLIEQDNVKYVLGYSISPTMLAAQRYTDKNKVIMAGMGYAKIALGEDHPYTFRGNVSTSEFAYPQINWEVKQLNIKKIGALLPNDATGQELSKDMIDAYKKSGAELDPILYFQRDATDFVSMLTKLLASGIEALELDGNAPETAGLITRQIRDLGFEGPILRAGGPASEVIVKVAGKEAAEGIYVHDVVNLQDKKVRDFIKTYEDRFEMSMNPFVPNFYDMTRMYFHAMKTAETVTDTTKVRDALAKIKDFPGVGGHITMIGEDVYGVNHQVDTNFFVAQIQNGEEVVVASCTVTDGCKTVSE